MNLEMMNKSNINDIEPR